jgi:hypothetical protein
MKNVHLYLILIVVLLISIACNLPFNRTENGVSSESKGTLTEGSNEQLEATLIPNDTMMPNQGEVFQVGDYSIVLPVSFIVSDDLAGLPVLQELLDIIAQFGGNDVESVTTFAKENIVLLGYDSEEPKIPPTSFLVLKNEQFSGAPLGLINVFVENILGDAVNLLESETVQLGGRRVIRWLASVNLQGRETSQVIYLFKDYDQLWIIAFLADPASVKNQIAIFDDAIASFSFKATE